MGNKLNLIYEVAKRVPRAMVSRANIAMTFRCNQRCRMCNIWQYSKKQDIDNELDSVEIYKVIKRNKLIWVSLTGGEPFLNNHIINSLRISMLNCNLVSIVSNGSLPELIYETVRDSLRRTSGLLVFSVSLEGDEANHDYVTRTKGSYKKVVETIEKLKKISDNKLYLGIEHLLSEYTNGMLKYVESVANFYDIGITYTREQKAPYYHNENGLNPAIVQYPDYSINLKPFDIAHNLFMAGLKKNSRKLCEAGKYSVFINPYMNLYPCLPQAPDNPIKNLRDADYVIGDIKKESKELYKKCKSPCYTPCEVYASMLFRPWRLL